MTHIKPNEVLDCRGTRCPLPILKTKKAVATMTSGQILEVQSSDPGTKNDLPGVVTRDGHEYLGEVSEKGYTRLFIKIG